MARYGTWRPLADNWAAQPRMRAHDIICLHTMVGSLAGTDSMFRRDGYANTESHFGVGHDGTVWQWQDTAYQADANYRGNDHLISIETADFGPGFPAWNPNDGNAVPAWTDAQVESIARLVAFLCREHRIPCELIPNSRRGWRGIGYHRQGIDGAYTDARVPDGEVWSTARGKVCPGARRIAQIPRVIARAREVLALTPPAPPKTLRDEVDMATLDELRALVTDVVRREVAALVTDILRRDVAAAVWSAQVPDYFANKDQPPPIQAGVVLGWLRYDAAQANNAAHDAADNTDKLLERPAAGGAVPDPEARYRLVPE